MAGMEQIEVHSKAYIVRWVSVAEGNTISWSLQPHKKSLNFGIVKHPGSTLNGSSSLPSINDENQSPLPSTNLEVASKPPMRRLSTMQGNNETLSTAQAELKRKGFTLEEWHGKCEADKVSLGTYVVRQGAAGMYGLVFDNTFSKTTSKTATFVLLTYPTNAPPNQRHQGNLKPNTTNSHVTLKSVSSKAVRHSESADSLHGTSLGQTLSANAGISATENINGPESTYHVGVLWKRRRKRGQGWAKRYFSLDFVSCTLAYYYNRNSSALRGAIPLSLAAISADEKRKEISVDSGAEIWHMRASNAKDFDGWTKALEIASSTARADTEDATLVKPSHLRIRTSGIGQTGRSDPEEDRDWEQVEALVSRIAGIRDAVRRLTRDTTCMSSRPTSAEAGTSPGEDGDYFAQGKRPFWRRKSSMGAKTLSPGAALTAPVYASRHHTSQEENGIHEHCAALLSDLDNVLSQFSIVVGNSKRRRMAIPASAVSRRSMDTVSTELFYDAEGGDTLDNQILMVKLISSEESPGSERDDFVSDRSSIASSSSGASPSPPMSGTVSVFPARPKSLAPLPVAKLKRRKTVPPTKIMPPSLIAFLRKNVGKDFSTITMPVSSNEPTSLLQRLAENMEYSNLLDLASQHPEAKHRLLYVSAFAVSTFSNGRAKERAIRKPFNPMLGETFELVRGEGEGEGGGGGYRFIAEKVCHRPVKLACQADSLNWSFSHSPAPTQKFWGKSAEIQTEGRVRVVLRLKDGTDECYSWAIATVFLRNVVMGEKYVEPTGSMNVNNETSGSKAIIDFKTKGMFGGRSEDVVVETYGENGAHTGISLTGTWTTSLRVLEAGKSVGAEIWHVGKLIDNSVDRYGFTEFAASLNEITDTEKGFMAITDSRYRKDQRAAEEIDLVRAEELKKEVEDMQRLRRTDMESEGKEWEPRWFSKYVPEGADGEEVWRLKGGKDGYWEERARGQWSGVVDVLGMALTGE